MTAITLPHSHENGDAISHGQDAEDIQDLLQIVDSKSQQLWEINQKVQSLIVLKKFEHVFYPTS